MILNSNTGLHFNCQQVRPAIVHASPQPPLKPYLLGHVALSSVCKHQTAYATTSHTFKKQTFASHLSAIFCWETLNIGICMDVNWHKPPTQTAPQFMHTLMTLVPLQDTAQKLLWAAQGMWQRA